LGYVFLLLFFGNAFPPSIHAALLVFSGGVYLLAPRKVWYLVFGWQLKNAEPTEGGLKIYRLFGLLMLIIGLGTWIRLAFPPV
jgi:hypothetical protein